MYTPAGGIHRFRWETELRGHAVPAVSTLNKEQPLSDRELSSKCKHTLMGETQQKEGLPESRSSQVSPAAWGLTSKPAEFCSQVIIHLRDLGHLSNLGMSGNTTRGLCRFLPPTLTHLVELLCKEMEFGGLLAPCLCSLMGPTDCKVDYNLVAGEREASFLFKEARRPYVTPALGSKLHKKNYLPPAPSQVGDKKWSSLLTELSASINASTRAKSWTTTSIPL